MADIKLKDGREIEFDLEAVTWPEYTAFRAGTLDNEGDYALLSKVSGLTVAELKALSLPQFRRLARAFFKRATEPLTDPN